MIFNILIFAAIAGIAYFHYAQGFFSAFFSAVIAIIAAAMAVSYHEPIITGLLGGKMGDYAHSMVLVGIFALVYTLLRVLVDKAVPGNIRLPVIIDRVGGAAMGLVAGIFAAGIFALAGAALPFSPGVYERYKLEDRPEVTIPIIPGVTNTQTTPDIYEQLTEDRFTAENHKGLWIPADDIVLRTVQALSDGGSLAGSRSLYSIHPSYADELFAQRLGIQVGTQHTAMNLPGRSAQVTVPEPGVFRVDADFNKEKAVVDAEMSNIHQRAITAVTPADPADKLQLVIRVKFERNSADSDQRVRLSPASVRLCANGRNYFPVGTLENGRLLMANKVDDFLIVNIQPGDRAADFVFLVNPQDVIEGGAPAAKGAVQKIKDNVFVEVKRLARVDLSGRDVKAGVTPSADVVVERKIPVMQGKKGIAPDTGGPVAETPAFVFQRINANKTLFNSINVGTPDKDVKGQQIKSGTLSMQSRQFTQLDLTPTESLQVLGTGDYLVNELFEPVGMKLMQVQGTPPPEEGDPWAWGALSSYELIDAAGKKYAPSGAFARVKKDNTERMVASYNATGKPKDITGSPDDGRPTDVWIGFLVPSGTHLKQLMFKGKSIATFEQVVP